MLGGRFGERPIEVDVALLDAWREAGGALVETAHAYADGAAEQRIGAWLRTQPPGDAPGVVTKVGHPLPDGTQTLDPASLRRQLETSLRRLGIDQVALLLLHRDDLAVPVERFADELRAVVARGDALAVGVANWSLPRLRALHDALGPELAATSEQWSLARPRAPLYPGTLAADSEYLEWHAATGVPLLAWSANAGGWFAGRGASGPFDTAANRAMRELFARQAAHLGIAPATLALHHALGAAPRVLATVGPESPAELAEALAATRLDARSLSGLDAALS